VWPRRVLLTERAPKVAFPSGRFARGAGRQRRPQPSGNVAGRLFSAAGFHPALPHAADLFEVSTGSVWRPRAGSILNHRALTAAVIDRRDYLAARRRAETELRIPAGTSIAFTGSMDCNDHHRIWAVLDKARAKHPDMVLLHGGRPKGAERIAACWADHHKVAQILFKPDWARHAKAAPFKRNDQMLEALPAGLPSPAPASPPTSPTRLGSWAFRCGASSPRAPPRKRRPSRMTSCSGWQSILCRERPNGEVAP
jgi:hypothetical protein